MKNYKKGDIVEVELNDWNIARFQVNNAGRIIGKVQKNKGDSTWTTVKDAVDVELTKTNGSKAIFAIERSELI